MDSSGLAGATFPVHRASTMAAEELSGQEVIHLGFAPCRGFCVLREPTAHRFKQFLVNDGRNASFHLNIFVGIDPDISFITEHGLETIPVKLYSLGCAVAFCVKHTANIGHGFPIGIKFKSLLDDMSGSRIDNQFMIFNFIAERNMTSYTMAFQGRLPHTSGDLLREVGRVKFRHTLQHSFKNNTLRFLRNVLSSRDDLYAVLSEAEFEKCAICSVPSKAVKFPNNHILPWLFLAVPYHLLEVNPFLHIFPGGGGPVYIDSGNTVAIKFAEGSAITELPFNGLFPLPLGAEPKVQRYIGVPFKKCGGVLSELVYFLFGQHGEVNGEFCDFHSVFLHSDRSMTLANNRLFRRVCFFFCCSVKFIHGALNNTQFTLCVTKRKVSE